MSGRDARLSAEERAALANLEAAAMADDPNLSTRLRGGSPTRWGLAGSKARQGFSLVLARLTHLGWWGAPVAAVGLAVIVISVATSVWLGLLGAALAVSGLTSVAHAASTTIRRRASAASRQPPVPD